MTTHGTTGVELTTPGEREVRAERTFAASPERVWRALTEPDLVARWWGRGNPLVIEHLEMERGGRWRFVEHAPDGVHGFGGHHREVVPGRRLVRTFEWDGMPGHLSVETMELDSLPGGGTLLVVTARFDTVEERDGMVAGGMADGLAQSYRALDALLASMD